ncbi:MAG: DivIVA domain-containing protein [Clostridia bacterium]|nr:DivIVA domain-containing protein [Clostridia bacterium]
MLTPLEIQKIEFQKKMGKYVPGEVDEIFAVIAGDYETLYKENIKLRDRLEVLEDLVNKYKSMEDTMRDTLIVAQKAADDLGKSAAQKAEAIIQKAENEAEMIREGARVMANQTLTEREKLANDLYAYSAQIDSILDAQKQLVAQILNSRSDKDGLQSNTESSEN